MKTNFKQIKNLINKLEKKEKELAAYRAKAAKLEAEIKTIQTELTNLLGGNKTTAAQTNTFAATYNG